jgi:hypothetical protein
VSLGHEEPDTTPFIIKKKKGARCGPGNPESPGRKIWRLKILRAP